jgi:hypothetical protein
VGVSSVSVLLLCVLPCMCVLALVVAASTQAVQCAMSLTAVVARQLPVVMLMLIPVLCVIV